MKAPLKVFKNWPVLCLLLGGLGSLYFQAFIFPSTPVYQGDTAPIFLAEAVRMFEGQMIYRDFFEFVFPGTQGVYWVLFNLFGVRAWLPSAVFILLGVGLAWAGAVVSKGLMSNRLALLPSLLFLAFAFSSEPDATHHWFSSLAVMAALGHLIEKRTFRRLAGGGVLCGLAILFTQSRGAVAILGIAVFVLWERRTKKQGWRNCLKAEACLFAGVFVTTLPVVAYLSSKVGLGRLTYSTCVFLIRYWGKLYWGTPQVYMANPPSFPIWLEVPALGIWLFIHALLPFVYLIFFWRYRREAGTRPQEPWDRLMFVSIVGLFLFLGIASSPVWFRLISVSLPALIVFVWLVESSGKLPRMVTALLWAAGLLALVIQPVIVQTGWRGVLDSPTGRVAFLDSDRYEKYRWVSDRTRSGDYFFQADDLDLYFPLGLRNPSEVYFVTASDFTRPEQVQNVVEALERHRVRFVVWSAWLDVPQINPGQGDHLAPLRVYLHTHYHPVKSFTDPDFEEAWERSR